MKLISKHLPLLALALLVGSTQLRAEELPFKIGDKIYVNKPVGSTLTIEEIKGKWVRSGGGWYNSDQWIYFSHETK